jgi:lipoate-protein ligase A
MSFYLLRLKSCPVLEQLQLEEMLLRTDSGNWCIINEGSTPAIVMGISGKKEELVDCRSIAQDNILLIKRFSGGGTVIVDENTLFVTFICQKQLHDFPSYPEPIMKWTEKIYKDVFQHPEFHLRENDYVFGDRKCGGNAQYIKKERWLHHTCFLWDYKTQNMEYLLHPQKAPPYRAGRPHEDFLCRISEFYPDKEALIQRLIDQMQNRFFLQTVFLEEALKFNNEEARRSTHIVPLSI